MSVKTYSLKANPNLMLSEHFALKEFACNDGSDTVKVDTDLVELLETIRSVTGPIVINSAYRTESYNKKVGGATKSQHVVGTAADITISGFSPLQVAKIAECYLGNSGGIGLYNTFTHVDVRASKSRWNSTSGKEVVVSGYPGWEPTVLDNTPSEAHKEGVEWAVKNGILQGNSNGDLMLSSPVTRQQMCTMLYRLYKLDK